jgi:hypothetical protein
MIKTFAALVFAVLAGFGAAVFFGVPSEPSPMDSPPPTSATVLAELEKLRAARLERAARGLRTQLYDEQIALREVQLRAIESMKARPSQP